MGTRSKFQEVQLEIKKLFTWSYLKGLVVNPAQVQLVAFLIILAELVLNIVIVERVPYTEIDWKAYMQECEGFLNGTLNYTKLRGDTGPLVYPAGFVYIYSIFYFLTEHGKNIKFAQYIFIGVYLILLTLVLRIYIKTRKVPPYVLVITILTSYRIHSIHVLRMFNDPVAVLFLYASLNLFLDSQWYLGSLFYSLAVSIKMNILLYAPALFFFYLVNLGTKGTILQIFVCAVVQLLLGLPFLLVDPKAYIKGSFDLGRVFNHTWTVNYRFLDVKLFENPEFHITLLSLHVLILIIFIPMCIKYFKSYCRLKYVQKQVQPQIDAQNQENKRKTKLKNVKPKTKEIKLSKEQEDFLNSFEAMLQKSSKKVEGGHKKPQHKKFIVEEVEEQPYSINFDVLSQLFILPMFLVNFIGIVCARSLHYQFYSWYFHTLPYLLWSTNYSVIVRFLILALIELCWNTYPSTEITSVMLHICHLTILYGVFEKMSKELNIAAKVQ
ncbi:lethal(2)neighbour of tid protein 2 [Bicyclus anynana]|uniref:dolichyl-P-Man:Man5GlcNAc2-PP-dolichol alpha-1,3-mannosyltransferase n=1 Tax=Bicyclus anynana TaxID=110368 RepID=A0A6J1MNI2_BICAN|nr:lethal(2)neighbour of tid protein 2 [Bicyclus anynana]